ncbi:Uncharacterised protein [Klebsiella pneumoniae]|nr:Uncharacterised protein [Klebsiella pneumoniae]
MAITFTPLSRWQHKPITLGLFYQNFIITGKTGLKNSIFTLLPEFIACELAHGFQQAETGLWYLSTDLNQG